MEIRIKKLDCDIPNLSFIKMSVVIVHKAADQVLSGTKGLKKASDNLIKYNSCHCMFRKHGKDNIKGKKPRHVQKTFQLNKHVAIIERRRNKRCIVFTFQNTFR